MFKESIEKASVASAIKIGLLKRNFLKYFILSVMAGFYVGIGIFLIQSVGAPLSAASSPFTKLIMGISFSISLTLVVFAGSELFTGNTMVMTIGFLNKRVTIKDVCMVLIVSYAGNMLGGMALGYFIKIAGLLTGVTGEFISASSMVKMNLPIMQLFVRGIICNMLVCLAIWMSYRTQSDTTKYIFIFLCLFAFISSGYEHCIANMSLLFMGILSRLGDCTIIGYFYNLLWVTLGNIVGGALFIGAGYWYVSSNTSN